MAIFASKNGKAPALPEVNNQAGPASRRVNILGRRDLNDVILRSRITEKATTQAESGVYAFEVSPRATKTAVASAVEFLFKVKPVKVAMIPIRSKQVTARGKKGRTRGGKKAYVFLKKGDKIDFV